MPCPSPLTRRTIAAIGLAAALAATVTPPVAADAGPAVPAGATAAAAPAADAAASAAAAPAPAARSRGPQDPLEMLRERLARRLGATPAPGSGGADVLRVVSKSRAAGAAAAEPPLGRAAGATAAAANAGPASRAGAPAAPQPARHAARRPAAHWGYDGAGPAAWGAMQPQFATCDRGHRQSPIDIRDGIKVDLEPIRFDYRPSSFGVIDNGHTVQVNVASGNVIEVTGRRYELVQFHFHRPSEERIDGRQFDMVVHLVHRDPTGRLAVVAVLLERGSAQPLVQRIWNDLPLEKGEEVPGHGRVDLAELLPAERGYFTYMGSLTTPPCTEGVLWMVMKRPVAVSADQLAIFARLYPMNARPVQPDGGRLIKESN